MFQSNVAGNTHVEEGRERSADARDPDGGQEPCAAGTDLGETADGLRQVVGAPSWENQPGRTPGRSRPAPPSPCHRHVRDAVELVFTAATPATTPKVTFVPAGTVHARPAPPPGGRVFIFEIK